ncbi:MAG: methyl-accepting chemotaxis protein [Vogesella sp.]|nr:methyl-accepting chemotaxis protein [Vogesella sp.]
MSQPIKANKNNVFLRNVIFSAVLLVLVALGFIGMVIANRQLSAAELQRYVSYQLADELRQSSDDLTRLARTYVITQNAEYEREYLAILDIRNGKKPRPQNYNRIYWDFVAVGGQAPRPDSGDSIALLDLMRQNGFTDAELAKLDEAKKNSDGLVGIEVEAMGLVKKDTSAEALSKAAQMMHDSRYHAEKAKIMRPIDDFYQLMEARTSEAIAQASAVANVLTLLFIIAVVCLTVMLWITYRSLQAVLGAPVEVVKQHIARMADGDFSHVIQASGAEDNLMAHLADMQQRLSSLINKVRHASRLLSQQTGDINSAATDAVGYARDQAQATAAMAASLEQLVVSINHASDNARDTQAVAAGSEDTLEHGGTVIRETVTSIESIAARVRSTSSSVSELNVHAQQINMIVNVIKDIADQTNLLALNAAIEAARAGEQGRGFAVVADEVRKLAERTAMSTQEITATISKIQQGTEQSVQSMSDGVQSVDQGVEMANQAGAALQEIRHSANQIIAGISDISHVLQEQATAANHVASNVERVSQLADSSSARIGVLFQSAEVLHQVASSLGEDISHFRLAGQ